MAILAVLMGSQSADEFRALLPAALNFGVTPVEAKEIVYQAVAYLGIGRVFPFLKIANEVLVSRGVPLPLAPQNRTTADSRLEKGEEAQVRVFGEGIAASAAPALRKRGISGVGSRTTASETTTQGAG